MRHQKYSFNVSRTNTETSSELSPITVSTVDSSEFSNETMTTSMEDEPNIENRVEDENMHEMKNNEHEREERLAARERYEKAQKEADDAAKALTILKEESTHKCLCCTISNNNKKKIKEAQIYYDEKEAEAEKALDELTFQPQSFSPVQSSVSSSEMSQNIKTVPEESQE